GEALTHHRLVIHDQYRDGHGSQPRRVEVRFPALARARSGISAVTEKPPSEAGNAENDPPTARTRADIPGIPVPPPVPGATRVPGAAGPLSTSRVAGGGSASSSAGATESATTTSPPGAWRVALASDSCSTRCRTTPAVSSIRSIS